MEKHAYTPREGRERQMLEKSELWVSRPLGSAVRQLKILRKEQKSAKEEK